MKQSTLRPLSKTIRMLFLVILVLALTVSSGQMARAETATTQTPVFLGRAVNFAILTKSGITNVPISAVVGNMGTSPIAGTAITGFSMVADASNRFSTSDQVTGRIFAANFADPTPIFLTTAISNMETAYRNAAGRKNPNYTELYAGNLSGRTLRPGLYKWSTGVFINNRVVLKGGPTDVWIFQISGNLRLASDTHVVLAGGAQAKNIFWQVAGGAGVTIGTTAHMEGTILARTAIHLRTGASLNGRALAQTAVTLQKNRIVIKK